MFSQHSRFLLVYVLLACFLAACLTAVLAQTAGGTVVTNQASMSYSMLGLDSSTTSNTVESVVPSLCTFAVTPDGSVASPSRTVSAVPGVTVYFPYTLNYTGNVVTDIQLTALVEASSTLLPNSSIIILDSNNNQLFDAGEPVITSLTTGAIASSTSLLLAVTLESSYPSGGVVDVNLRASTTCAGGTVTDDDNVSRVNVLRGGVVGLSKTSVPPSNSQVSPGEAITYTIGFTVNEVTLTNVVLTDVLDSDLSAPTALSVTVSGLALPVTYDASTRTVRATLGTLNPGDSVVLRITATVLAGTAGGVTIDNQATLSFDGGTLLTNPVTHVTPATCVPVIKPDGSVAAPAFVRNVLPGGRAVFAYTLTNLGNVTNDFLLETALSNQDFTPTTSVVVDGNDNDVVDAGETPVSRLDDLAPGASVNLLLVVDTPRDAATTGNAFVNIIARCALATAVADSDNISQVTIPTGGILGLQKSSEPAAGSILYPSAEVRYFIDFEAAGRDLSNVVVTDVLDTRLVDPSSFTTGEIRDDESGLTTTVVGIYDAATRTLRWNVSSVPAGMKVRLEVVTAVRSDVQLTEGDVLSNTATFSADDVTETPTNTVTHPLNQLDILLSKRASPEQVFVGDTLTYTLTIINPVGNIALRELILSDTLPNELRYQPGTARVALPGQTEQALEPTIDGQRLTWALPGIQPGEQIIVTIDTDVLAAAAEVEEILNTAEVVASDANGRAVADAAAEAATIVEKGLFTAPAVLLGTVFEDLDGNNLYDEGNDVPVSGVRVYLSDGRSVVSDELGRYTFLELRAGIEVVKVDATTLPARLLSETKTEVRPGLWRVRLEEGLITRQDVPLLPPGARVAVSQSLNVVMGPVRVEKHVVASTAGTKVVLEVSSSQALKNLVIQDALPAGVTVSGEVVSDDLNVTVDDLSFNLGNIASGYKAVIEYAVQADNVSATDLLLAPTVSWQVRP
jgi:fimbrial isopeptide formation D2 family protein/uncharacterized repeat protein (TIGR01451 family)